VQSGVALRSLTPLLIPLALAMVASLLMQALSPPWACNLGSGEDLACARGFETRERAADSSFRWSDSYAEIVVSGLGYGAPSVVTLTLQSGRPAGTAPVAARFGLHGRTLADVDVSFVKRHYALLLPSRPLTGDQSRVQIASSTWKPSRYSERNLGLVVFSARAAPASGFRVPGALLLLGWGALFLVAMLWAGDWRARWWVLALPLLLLPLAALVPLAGWLPWLAVVAGGAALVWRRAHLHAPAGTLLWGAGAAALYLLLVVGVEPEWGRGVVLAGCGALALVGALRWRGTAAALIWWAVVLRLALLAVRVVGGYTWLDADVELFYAYGMALREIGLPEVEYPTGAVVAWGALGWLSGDSREAFALLLPLVNIACDGAIVAALLFLGQAAMGRGDLPNDNDNDNAVCMAPAALYALSPLLEPFVFAKYDALPAALMVGALALFARGRAGLAGAAAGLGTVIKWVPALVTPFLAWHLLRQRRWPALARLIGLCILVVALFSVPFALLNWEALVLPYRLQGGRAMNGESVWALLALLVEPGLSARLDAPWAPLHSDTISVGVMVGGQMASLGVLALAALVRPTERWRTLVLAALAGVLFLVLNRIFSPQYLLPISAGVLAALALLRPSPRVLWLSLAALVLAQVANLLVWPFFVGSGWLLASGAMFASLLALALWCGGAAVRR
jgi:hypothetical protein